VSRIWFLCCANISENILELKQFWFGALIVRNPTNCGWYCQLSLWHMLCCQRSSPVANHI
jgi:hypothetical protein